MIRVTQVSESTFTVQGHGVHTAFTELTAALKKHPGVEVTVNKHGAADITHIHTIGVFALPFLLMGKSKKIVSAHIVPESLRGSLILASFWLPLATRYLRWFYNRADLVLAVSDSTKRELRRLGVKAPIRIVYNMVNVEQYKTTEADRKRARKILKINEDDWVVIGAGQVQPRKRIDSFIKAAKQLPGMRFMWVGGMPFGAFAAENNAMKKLINEAPANVSFSGVIEHYQVRHYYQAGDVFWLPSSQETFGLVVVEAAAAGLPVMVRNIEDYRETFAGDVLMEDEETFAATLQRLRDDKVFYDHAAKRAQNVVKRYSIESGIERMLDVYRGLLPHSKNIEDE